MSFPPEKGRGTSSPAPSPKRGGGEIAAPPAAKRAPEGEALTARLEPGQRVAARSARNVCVFAVGGGCEVRGGGEFLNDGESWVIAGLKVVKFSDVSLRKEREKKGWECWRGQGGGGGGEGYFDRFDSTDTFPQ